MKQIIKVWSLKINTKTFWQMMAFGEHRKCVLRHRLQGQYSENQRIFASFYTYIKHDDVFFIANWRACLSKRINVTDAIEVVKSRLHVIQYKGLLFLEAACSIEISKISEILSLIDPIVTLTRIQLLCACTLYKTCKLRLYKELSSGFDSTDFSTVSYRLIASTLRLVPSWF